MAPQPWRMTPCTLLLALALTLLPGPAWPRPQGSNDRINTLRMIGRNMKEARVNLRLAISMERELRKAAQSFSRRGAFLVRRTRHLEEQQEEEEEDIYTKLREEQGAVRAGAGTRKRRPFGPWAGR